MKKQILTKKAPIMKETILIILPVLFFILFTHGSCERDEETGLKSCDDTCADEKTIESIENDTGKIFINNHYVTNDGDTNAVFGITVNHEDFKTDTFTLFPENERKILVPCNLPNEFNTDNLLILFSGKKKSCCNELTQPNWRISYGCKLELTKIRKISKMKN